MNENRHVESRRDFVKKAAYVAPVIMSLKATSALAATGSPRTRTRKDVEADLHHWREESKIRLRAMQQERAQQRRAQLRAAWQAAMERVRELIEELRKFMKP